MRCRWLWIVAVLASPGLAGAPRFALQLPGFTLSDPSGARHEATGLLRSGLVLVVSAPTYANEEAQKGWDTELRRAHPAGRGTLVFLEDMTPSWFQDLALSSMRDAYRPGREPVLLIDPEGEVRRSLGVAEDVTVVLVYGSDGRLLHSEEGAPSAAAARRAWRALPAATVAAPAPALNPALQR